MSRAFKLISDEATLEQNIAKHNNIIDSLKYFSKCKNFIVLLCLFLFFVLVYLDFYVLAFLAEKIHEFSIQDICYIIILSGLLGYFIFSFFLVNTSRVKMNFTITCVLLFLSLVLVVCSKTLSSHHLDIVGFIILCTAFYLWFLILSHIQDFRIIRAVVQLLVQCGIVSFECARLHHRSADPILQLKQLGNPVSGDSY